MYLSHFMGHFYGLESERSKKLGRPTHRPWDWIRTTPITFLYHGYFWVVVFFMLSGFVLPMRLFKTNKISCFSGGSFRRYLRLMLPLWVIISLYFLSLELDLVSCDVYQEIHRKNFWHFCADCLFGVWFGDTSWAPATWTLGIELKATFLIYLVAFTVRDYR